MYVYISSPQTRSLATSSLYSCATFDAVGRPALSQALSKYFAPSVMMNAYFISFPVLRGSCLKETLLFSFVLFFVSFCFFFLFSFE